MKKSRTKYFFLFLKIAILALFFGPLIPYLFANFSETMEIYQSPNALGRADTYLVDAGGDAALFYNPATLGKEKKGKDEAKLSLEGFTAINSIFKTLSDKSLSILSIIQKMKSDPGVYFYNRDNALFTFNEKNWGFAMLADYRVMGDVINTTWESDSTSDLVAAMGRSMQVGKGILTLGATVKGIVRNEMKGLFDTTQLNSTSDIQSHSVEGLGLGADFGAVIKPKSKSLPQFGFSWRDAFGTHFFTRTGILNPNAGHGLPQTIPQSFNAGMAFHPQIFKPFTSSLAFEVHHIERSDLSFSQKLAIGAELSLKKYLAVDLGLREMYPTFGIMIQGGFGQLVLGYYAEEESQSSISNFHKRVFLKYGFNF